MRQKIDWATALFLLCGTVLALQVGAGLIRLYFNTHH